MVGRRANAVARQTRRFDRDQRHDVSPLPCLRARSVHLDEPDSSLRDLGLDRAADGDEVPRFDRRDRKFPSDSRRVGRDAQFAFAVIVLRDPRGRRQDIVDRLAEPLLGAAADELAADDEHEYARHDRQAQEGQHQLGPEPGERQPTAALDDELHDVAGENEDQRHEHRQIGG